MRIAVLAFLVVAAPALAQEAKWLASLDEAAKQAKADKKLVLASFVKTDGSLCQKLKDEVFSTKEFAEWAGKNAVLLELDEKKAGEKLLEKYGIKSYPTVVFLDADLNEKGRTAYVKGGPAAWIKKASEAIEKGAPAEKPAKKPAEAKKDSAWLESWEKAAEKARKDGKVVLADFTGSDWCPWCIKLKKEVFDKPEFKKWAADHVVLLEVDFPHDKPQTDEQRAQNAKLQEKYAIEGYPTVLILDADGKKLGELGYEEGGPKPWIEKAQGIIDRK